MNGAMGLFDHMTDDRRRQLVGVLLLFLGLLVGVSLGHARLLLASPDDLGPEIWTTQLGVQNRQVSNWLFDLLGLCAWVVPRAPVSCGDGTGSSTGTRRRWRSGASSLRPSH